MQFDKIIAHKDCNEIVVSYLIKNKQLKRIEITCPFCLRFYIMGRPIQSTATITDNKTLERAEERVIKDWNEANKDDS